jgi:uroporphyrinogen decarboxylase
MQPTLARAPPLCDRVTEEDRDDVGGFVDKHQRMIAAMTGEAVDRTPVWFMRQAGRYLPEYMEVRRKVSFLELCRSPELAVKVTLQPIERFDCDAAIIFSDILTVLEAIGREVVFEKGVGPRLPNPIRNRSDAASLSRPSGGVGPTLQVAADSIAAFKRARPDTPVLGFAGSPFTLLCYLVDGGGSKNWVHTKRLLMSDPETGQQLLNLLADVVGDHLQNQVEHGALAVQMFDTWAGALSPEDYRRWALPAAQRALSGVTGAPTIYFTRDSACFLPWLKETGCDAVGLDWRVDIGAARKVLGDIPVQGNLDPVALYGPAEGIQAKVHRILEAAGPRGHVFNLGHGVLPDAPIEGVHAMIDAVRNYIPQG